LPVDRLGQRDLQLTDEITAALERELRNIIDNERYPFSPHIRTLQAIREKIRPEPKPEPLCRRKNTMNRREWGDIGDDEGQLFRPTDDAGEYGICRCSPNRVNAGEKMYQRAGVKLHHRGVPNAPPEGFLLHDKQDEKRIASSANVPETSSVASPSVLPLPQSILRPAPAPLSES
jgi:hypothetical protein